MWCVTSQNKSRVPTITPRKTRGKPLEEQQLAGIGRNSHCAGDEIERVWVLQVVVGSWETMVESMVTTHVYIHLPRYAAWQASLMVRRPAGAMQSKPNPKEPKHHWFPAEISARLVASKDSMPWTSHSWNKRGGKMEQSQALSFRHTFHQPFLHLSLHGWWPRVTCWQRSPKVIEIHDLGTFPWQGFKALDPFRFHLTSKYSNLLK